MAIEQPTGAHPREGHSYPPLTYAAGREKIVEFATATGETDPRHLDPAAARAAGHADVVAPPMFAAVYQLPAMRAPLSDPELGIDFAHLLHGAQEFRWGPLVVAGDELTTTVTVGSVRERAGLWFYVLEGHSVNQRGETVADGTWTNIVREAS